MTFPNGCRHVDFIADVQVHRITEGETQQGEILEAIAYAATVNVQCTDCGEPFGFIGLPAGVAGHRATRSMDGLEARLPIGPKSAPFGLGVTITNPDPEDK